VFRICGENPNDGDNPCGFRFAMLLCCCLFSGARALYRWETLAVACFFLGFVSHLAADSLNPTGIKWLQPFSKAKVKDGIKTGSAAEKLPFSLTVVAILIVPYLEYFPDVSSGF